MRETINARHTAWIDRADADGVRDLYQLQAAMARGLVQDGEAFAVMGADPDTGEARVRLHPPEAVDALYDRDRIVAGIEFDSYGRRIAYHILRDSHPDRARPRSRVRRGARLQGRCAGTGPRGVVVRARSS